MLDEFVTAMTSPAAALQSLQDKQGKENQEQKKRLGSGQKGNAVVK